MSNFLKLGFVALLLMIGLAGSASAQLSTSDQDTMTRALERLSVGWDDMSVSTANGIITKPAYSDSVWTGFFESFFSTHKLTSALSEYLGYPSFFWFDDATHYKLQISLSQIGRTRTRAAFQNHAGDLGQYLDRSAADREDLINWLHYLATIGSYGAAAYDRRAFFDWTKQLIRENPNWLGVESVIDPNNQPYANWARMQIHMILRDILPLTASVKSEIAEALALSGLRFQLWDTHSLLVHDNSFFNPQDFRFLETLYDAIPPGLRMPGNLSVNQALGNGDSRYNYVVAKTAVNVFSVHAGEVSDNAGFPSDVVSPQTDLFSGVAVHECNHIIDPVYGGAPAVLKERRAMLLQDAGNDNLNYLRSMFDPGFFTQSPQEFFASISNMYCFNTELTFEVGRRRLEQTGRYQPIEQFLFFLDVYSVGSNLSRGYVIDRNANVTFYNIPLQRDEENRITSFVLPGGGYLVRYGSNAHVSGLDRAMFIASIDFDGKKSLTINGSAFGIAPRVLINGNDRSEFIHNSSDTSIKIKGKLKKLGLTTGDNTIQVVDGNGKSSNVFVIVL